MQLRQGFNERCSCLTGCRQPRGRRHARVLPKPAAAQENGKLSYEAAGVSIQAGDELVQRIRKLNPAIGGFNGLYPYGNDFLVAGTDGVGTKVKLAFEMGKHDTIGIDLVAMCVNDVVVSGAKPMFFLDYFATGKLDVDVAEQVVKGIVAGCEQCGALLMGGETAEMPDMYQPGEYDLAGFAVGTVSQANVISGADIAPGDKLVALPSTGVHSNGFSLVRKVLERSNLTLQDPAPWAVELSAGESLLTPTAIYVNAVLEADRMVGLKGVVHITGGGLLDNIPRVLPTGVGAAVDTSTWSVPPVFRWIQEQGGVDNLEMFRTFNMGVGMILVCEPEHAQQLVESLEGAFVVGEACSGTGVELV